MHKYISLILKLLGIGIVLFGLVRSISDYLFLNNAEYLQGEIIEIKKTLIDKIIYKTPIIAYMYKGSTLSVAEEICTPGTEANTGCPEIGDKASLIYNPKYPNSTKVVEIFSKNNVRHDYSASSYFSSIWIILLGVGIVAFSFTDIFTNHTRLKRN